MSAKSFFQKLHIGYMLDVVKGAVVRFPLAFIFALVLTVLAVAEVHDADLMSNDMLARTLLFLGQGVVLALGAQLLAEGRQWPALQSLLVGAGFLAALAATVYAPLHFSAMHLFMSAALLLFLLFAAFVARRVSEDTVWLFNYQSAMGVILGGIASLILCLGLCAILATVKYLFNVEVDDKLFGDIWIIGGGFFFPVFVLASVPRDLNDQSAICAMPVGVSFIANYLMVPMMLVYTGILYAYGIKIIVEWSLPKGNLGYMVTAYGSIGVITHLCIYPIRDTGTRLLRFFYRRFYVLLTGPLALLAAGIWTRINDYGLTEQRVAIVLCLVWLAILSFFHIFKRAEAHIKHVPMVLCIMALVAAFSAQKLSVQSQYERLAETLQRVGVLTDGKVVKVTSEVDFDTRKDISSMLDYLRERQSLHVVREWAEPFRDALLKNQASEKEEARTLVFDCAEWSRSYCAPRVNTDDLMQVWGMEYVNRWQTKQQRNNYHTVSLPHNYHSSGTIRLVAPYQYIVEFSSYVRKEKQNAQMIFLQKPLDLPGAFKRLTITLDAKSMLTIESNTGAKAVFDLRAAVAWARDKRPATISDEDLPRLTLAPVFGDMSAILELSSFTAGASDPKTPRQRGSAEEESDTLPEDMSWHMRNLSGTLLFSLPSPVAE